MERTPSLLIALCLCAACHPRDESKPPTESGEPATVHPTLMVKADMKQEILDRLDREPYASMLAALQAEAAMEWVAPDPEVWDEEALDNDAIIARANAFLAWLLDDEAAADKAREFLAALPTDFETNETWDVNIRMADPLMGFTDAWDLLRGTPWFPDEEAAAAQERITTVNRKFFERYVLTDIYRNVALGPSQNNHVIRTASAIGYVGLAFPDDPDAEAWTDFALSELDYLFSAEGQYIQADGGVSEGPFYYGFGHSAALAYAIAIADFADPAQEHHRTCINRQSADPWNVTDCVEGEPFTFVNLFDRDLYWKAIDWSLALRLPAGWRPPMEDAYFYAMNGMGILSALHRDGRYRWDWENNEEGYLEMGHGLDLLAHHLAWFDDTVTAVEPAAGDVFLPDAGQAVFRSGWGSDDLYLLLTAEHGSARKTLHDHVDGTSFSMAAYGEYLLVDPGYYKPNELDNAITSGATSHNVILVDGQGAPDKGMLTNFGDTDAFLENHANAEGVSYAEARESYEEAEIQRSAMMLRDRYFIVADRIESTVADPRSFTWRLGGWAGHSVGYTFTPRSGEKGEIPGATWERAVAGVDVSLGATAPGLRVEEPAYTKLSAPHVEEFDRNRDAMDHGVIDGIVQDRAPGFLAVLAPYPLIAASRIMVTALDLGEGATGFLVTGPDFEDLVVLRKPDAPTRFGLPDGSTLETDAEIVVVGGDGAFGLIARGTVATVGAREIRGDAEDGVWVE